MSTHADLIAEARDAVRVTLYLMTRVSGIPIDPWLKRVERLADALESAVAEQMRRDADLVDEIASWTALDVSHYTLRRAADRLRELADEAGRGGGA